MPRVLSASVVGMRRCLCLAVLSGGGGGGGGAEAVASLSLGGAAAEVTSHARAPARGREAIKE